MRRKTQNDFFVEFVSYPCLKHWYQQKKLVQNIQNDVEEKINKLNYMR